MHKRKIKGHRSIYLKEIFPTQIFNSMSCLNYSYSVQEGRLLCLLPANHFITYLLTSINITQHRRQNHSADCLGKSRSSHFNRKTNSAEMGGKDKLGNLGNLSNMTQFEFTILLLFCRSNERKVRKTHDKLQHNSFYVPLEEEFPLKIVTGLDKVSSLISCANCRI